jgi:hypothetical protein
MIDLDQFCEKASKRVLRIKLKKGWWKWTKFARNKFRLLQIKKISLPDYAHVNKVSKK